MKIFRRITIIPVLSVFLPLVVFVTLVSLAPKQAEAAQARISLLSADNFAVLAGSGISDTGTSVIIGDVGLSPTGGASITGLTCSEMTGTIYDTNGGYVGGGGGSTACLQSNAGLLITAKNDLTTAYNDAASRQTTATIATQLGGAILTDGVYDSAAGTFDLTGTVTLDGQGNSDSVFIFKMASTLITASSSRVVLTNGAQACNVYWQVGSSATLGTSTTLVGNLFALTSITDDGGSTVNGRLLARDGAVTLNNTTITKQSCVATNTTTSSVSSSTGTGSVCTSTPINTTPVILESRRISPTSISLSWGPDAGYKNFNVRYGLTNGNWLYNTNVTGFSTTINNLPVNQPIWIQVAARDDCSIGIYGESKFVGGPGLPNTGVAASNGDRFPWYIPVGGVFGTAILFTYLYRKVLAYTK